MVDLLGLESAGGLHDRAVYAIGDGRTRRKGREGGCLHAGAAGAAGCAVHPCPRSRAAGKIGRPIVHGARVAVRREPSDIGRTECQRRDMDVRYLALCLFKFLDVRAHVKAIARMIQSAADIGGLGVEAVVACPGVRQI
jgi:hypothetical protein